MTITIQPALADSLTREFTNTHIRGDLTELLTDFLQDYFCDDIEEGINSANNIRHPVLSEIDGESGRIALALAKSARDRQVFDIILREYTPNDIVYSSCVSEELWEAIDESLSRIYAVTPELRSQLGALGEVVFTTCGLEIWYSAGEYSQNANYLNVMRNNYALADVGGNSRWNSLFDDEEISPGDFISDLGPEPEIPFVPFGRAIRFEIPAIPVFKVN